MDDTKYPVESPAVPRSPSAPEIAVVGGNPVIGQALAQLLRGSGYRVNFLAESAIDGWNGSMDGYRLLVLAPGLTPERRERLLGKVASPAAGLFILELVSDRDVSQNGGDHRVLWPCPAERLRQEISALLDHWPPREDGKQ